LTEIEAISPEKMIVTMDFKKNASFSQKMAEIAENIDRNIDLKVYHILEDF
jgi:hypothetical protein